MVVITTVSTVCSGFGSDTLVMLEAGADGHCSLLELDLPASITVQT